MTQTESPIPPQPAALASPSAHSAFAALRYADFRRLMAGVYLFTAGVLIQEVVVGYELYKLTHDPLVLGLIGLAEAVPFISLALFGGHLADRRDKRRIMLMSLAFVAAGSAVLLWAMLPATRARLSQTALLGIIYGVIAAFGLARGFFTPAAGSLKPFLVPRELYPNSTAWSSVAWQSAAITGPGVAGFLYAGFGLTATLGIVIGLVLLALWLFAGIRTRPVLPAPAAGDDVWKSLREGIGFVWKSRILLYSISLDLFSVLFGGMVAILPIYATDILAVGAKGLGVLRAAPAVGALLTVLAATARPPTAHAWRNLMIAVAGFGVATLVFAVSKIFWLSALALFATGAFDSISVVIRGTILQVMPPDHLRGRVLSVNSVFISASNELGAFESGVAARLMGTVPSVVFGGVMTLLVLAYVWRRSRELFKVRLT